MARKKTASAGTARKTAKAAAPSAAPSIETAKTSAASVQTTATPAARAATAAAPAARATPAAVTTLPVKPAAAQPKAVRAAVPVRPAAAQPKAAQPKAARAVGKGFADLMTVGQDNLDACVTCGTIVAKGLETLGNEVMSLTQANIEGNLAATKRLMAAKTLNEVVELQTFFAQDRLEGMATETAKIGALTMRVANQALEPLRSRFDANTQTVFRPFGL